MSNRMVIACIVLLWGAGSLPGQESPFLDAKRFRDLRNEISGDIAYDYLRTLVQYHAPNGGSRGFRAEAAWVEQKAREVGLADVRYIPLKFKGTAWTPLSGELWLLAPEEVKLASFEEVATTVIDYSPSADISFLSAAAPSRGLSLYTKPVLSRLGSRERYGARVVPYFDSTDHHAFNEGFIGVAGVTFTNWPDEYIHSSDDDLWQIDRTQLQRNALAVAAATLYLAGAGEEQVREMTGYMAAAGRQRVWRDLQTGLDLVRQAAKSGGGAAAVASAYWDADNLVRQAVAREARALASLAAFEAPPATWVRARKALLAEEPAYLAQLAELYELNTAAKPPRRPEPSEAEKRCAARVPQNSATVEQYLDRRNQMKPVPGIHSLMRFEVLNFVDGKNTCLDIYKAVRAEAQAAGGWYYGQVTLDDVVRVLENAAEAQMIAWKGQ